jgi:hypothetical protein
MILGTDSNIFLYAFIVLIVGLGLLYSRFIENPETPFAHLGKPKKNVVSSISLFLTAILSFFLVILPSFSRIFTDITTACIIGISVGISLYIGHKLFNTSANFFSSCTGVCKLLLTIHGLIFLAFIQTLVLLQISDFLLQQYFGESNFSILVMMIVGAGIYTLVGGMQAVLYATTVTGIFSLVAFFLLILTSAVFDQPMIFQFHDIVESGKDMYASINGSLSSVIIESLGIAMAMLWLLWFEFGEIQRKNVIRNSVSLSKSTLIIGICLLVVFGFVVWGSDKKIDGLISLTTSPVVSGLNIVILLSFVSGLIGLFAVNFQSAGSIISSRLYPSFRKKKTMEEQTLIEKLAIVAFILLTIFLIWVSKVSGPSVFVWFIEYLAFFSTPIVVSFLFFAAGEQKDNAGFMGGGLAGEIFAMVGFILKKTSIQAIFFLGEDPYTFAFAVAVVTVVAGYAVSKLSEMRSVRELFSKNEFIK